MDWEARDVDYQLSVVVTAGPRGKGSEVQGYPQLHSKLRANLGYMKLKQKQQPKLCDL